MLRQSYNKYYPNIRIIILLIIIKLP
jgi:hypothetical protein